MIHLVSGKGGVGKSTVAAALAWNLASRGRKTLLVELGERSHFRHVFQGEVGPTPRVLTSHLSVTRWDGESCLREYLHHLLKIERIVRLFFDNRIMKSLVQAAPALRELAILGKMTSGTRHMGPTLPFDDLVIDGYATGHFRALWRAPIGMAEAIPFGPMGEQSRAIVSVLKNPQLTRFHVVMIAEDLPLTEGLELARDIQVEMDQIPHLFLNRWLECPLSLTQLEKFPGQNFATYLSLILQRQTHMHEVLLQRGQPLKIVPWLFADSLSEKVRQLAIRLEDKQI